LEDCLFLSGWPGFFKEIVKVLDGPENPAQSLVTRGLKSRRRFWHISCNTHYQTIEELEEYMKNLFFLMLAILAVNVAVAGTVGEGVTDDCKKHIQTSRDGSVAVVSPDVVVDPSESGTGR
jgi:hypothetical protein